MISYKYNIYHSKKTKYLDKMLRECCFVWNHALALQRRYHKLFGKYISVSLIIVTDYNPSNSYRKTHDGASIGLDFGLKTYLTKSDGSKIDSPLFFKQYQNKIRKLNKRLSNAKKGSNNRRRRLFELQQTYRKINDLRSNFQWKLAHDLCKQYDYIFIEDLNIEGMKRLWGKKVSDLSHSSFIDKLTYVASKYGVTIHKIDKWYPSSKTCECGCINKGLSLRDRTWVCPACGAVNDRDVLAARNILRKGISELESKSNSSDSNIGVSCAWYPRIPFALAMGVCQ